MGWVGGLLLEAQPTRSQGVAESEFLGDWKNQLPEEWRKHVDLSVLKVPPHSSSNSHDVLIVFFSVQILSLIERKDHVRHQFRRAFGCYGGHEYQRQTTRKVAREIQEHKAII